jgi:hypothetical protein
MGAAKLLFSFSVEPHVVTLLMSRILLSISR